LRLRIYHPHWHQWTLNFSNSSKDERGEFLDLESFLDARSYYASSYCNSVPMPAALNRHFPTTAAKPGVNWIATDTRINDESNQSN
jgi:hypothetical protein